MSIGIAVVSHISRRETAFELSDKVGANALFEDSTGLGCEANHRRAWDWATDHAESMDWAVVLEDDAVPVPDFTEQLDAALHAAPTPIVSLYLGTGNPTTWQPRIARAIDTAGQANWLVSTTLLHAVAVAIRTELLPIQLDKRMPIDNAISNWAKRNDLRVGYTLPSLVDHADTEPVITQRYDRKPRDLARRAHRVGTRTRWTRQLAPLN